MRSKLDRIGRYTLVGVFTNGSLFMVFLFLIWAEMAPLLASGLCYVMGVMASYLLNRSWTFSSTASHFRDLTRFLIAYGFGLVVTLVSMFSLVDPLGPAAAQLLTIGITALSIYSALEVLRFGR